MSTYRFLKEAQLDGKKVLLRAGFDVPMEDGVITDISRMEALVPTMRFILGHGASLVILSHQGRPKGKIDPEFTQRPLVAVLEKLLGVSVQFSQSCIGEERNTMVDALAPGTVLLLENVRYDAREEKNDEAFAQELAQGIDVYVNDAFTNCHRAHASMVALAKLVPSYAGLQLEEEVMHLSSVVENPRRPLTLIVSGAKIETKLPIIEFFLEKGDDILTGGAIANTLIASTGVSVGASLAEPAFYEQALQLLERSKQDGLASVQIPIDAVVATEASESAQLSVQSLDAIDAAQAIYDIGPATADAYIDIIRASESVVWNGPLGMYEFPQFANGSMRIAKELSEAAKRGCRVIIGGGDTIDFHVKYGLPLSDYTFVSTGGGAMLDFVSGKALPALEVLRD